MAHRSPLTALSPLRRVLGSCSLPRLQDPKARALDSEADDDAYAECYPGMAGYVGALVDSDDEGGDLDHMDSKQSKGKTRCATGC